MGRQHLFTPQTDMIRSQASGEKGSLDARQLKIAREAQARDGSLQLVARELGFDREEDALAGGRAGPGDGDRRSDEDQDRPGGPATVPRSS